MTPVSDTAGLAAAATTAPQITRSEVIQRAKSWVGIGLDYSWTGSYQGYRTDCSGYASMAWHLSSSLTTDTFASNGVTQSISKGDLKPGDALLNDSSGANGHIALFDKWIDSAHTSYMGYEFTGSGVHYREIPYPYYSGYGTFVPVRNKSVVDDVTAPADPGMTNLTAGDFRAYGLRDLVAVEVSTGKLWLYPNTGLGTLGARVPIGTGGWNGMSNLVAGDFNGDAIDDLVATEIESGKLYLYKGHGDGTIDGGSTRTEIGTGGWNSMSNLAVGDFNGDFKDDVVATETSSGKLYLYKGHGDGTIDSGSTRTVIGTGGWNSMNKVVGPGDMNKDGKDDLVATETSSGKLYLYKGHGDGTIDGGSTRTEIGTGGWNGISDYAGGDFTGDTVGDLVAVESQPGSTGKLYLYKGHGDGTIDSGSTRTEIGTGGW
ncbi:VCBS repeat-containing protein [Streptomyces sp. NBC_01643]|uniref:C40 family peptidase n=1 Tax=Streptomyces sp. NBC_01643 TaxID=2975906 RepID=UPI002F91288F|nr:VCBS repeat-containing protein [Streptomyces sp. NBC_01643]